MSIRDEGFFSPDIGGWVKQNRSENPRWFALADRLRRLSQRLLFAVDPPIDPNSITMLLIYARAVTSYQAAILLIERGLPADARTLARSFLETVMHFGAAMNDPEFYKRLVAADRRHKENIANPLVKMGGDKSGLDSKEVEKLEAWLADPDASKAEKLPIERIMQGMELGDIYDTFFRGLSGDAVHTTILSLQRHCVVDAQNDVVGTKWGPDVTDTAQTLMTLCSVMFYLLSWGRNSLTKEDGADEMEAAWAEYKNLVDAEKVSVDSALAS